MNAGFLFPSGADSSFPQGYQVFFEQAPDGIYLTDAETFLILDVNQAFLRMMGFSSKNELLGRSIFDLSNATREEAREDVRILLESGEHSRTVPRFFRRKDGGGVHINVSFSCSSHASLGKVLVSHVRDVTRETEMETINRISVELDRRILRGEHLDMLLSFIVHRIFSDFRFFSAYFSVPEPDGSIRYVDIHSVSPRFCEELREQSRSLKWNAPPGINRSSSRALFSRRAQFTLTKDADFSPLGKWYQGYGVDASFVIPILRDKEELFPWGTLTVSVKNRRDLPERLQTRLLEFSEKIRVAFTYYEEQKRIRLLQMAMESARNPSLIASPDGEIEWANESFCRMCGLDPSALSQSRIPELFPYPVLNRSVREILSDGRVFEGEWRGITRSGMHFLAEAMVSPIWNDQGKVAHTLVHLKDVTLDREKDQKIWRLAHKDPLTGLLNRNAFMERLREEILKAQTDGRSLMLAFLDLDGFKEVNDTLGHPAGDRFLQIISARLEDVVGDQDIVARIGGDEFILLKTDCSDSLSVSRFFAEILEKVALPVRLEGRMFHTTGSVGVSVFPGDGAEVEDLLRKADIAMYQAKSMGKNNCQFFEVGMEDRIRHRYGQGKAIREGLLKNEFLLYFQPQVDVVRKRVVGVESLIRWNRPGAGLLHPSSFISLAEETGLILPMGEWVLDQILGILERWSGTVRQSIRIGINVSARQFWTPEFWDYLTNRLSDNPRIASRLSLELTESLLIKDPEEAGKRLSILRDLGVLIAIDDFGTGYSSLSYLTRLPVDVIKIPQEFVLRMKESRRDQMMVRTIAQMSRNLKLLLVGEGAESPVEIDMLRKLGCSVIQGYGISGPIPFAELEIYLEQEWES